MYPSGPPSGPPVRPTGRDGADGPMPWVVPGAPPSGPPTGDPEPTFDGGGRRRILLAVVAIIGVLVLLTATVAFVGNDDDDGSAAPTTTVGSAPDEPSVTEPAAPTTTAADEPPVSDAEFLALIDELEAYVEQARGLEFVEEVVVELADDAEFEARLLEDFEEDIDEIEEAEVFYRALGLLEPDQDLLEELRAIYSSGVLGFYDPESNELVVRGRSPSPYVQQTIVHELVHALDDQRFELDRPAYDDRKDEISTGFSAVVEGNARRIENRWLGEQPAEFRQEAKAEEEAFGAGIDISAFPEILLFQIGAPYQLGEVFIGTLVQDGGERGVDAALTDPPDTSEQFLFPEVYAERDPRIEVPPPPADGDLVDDGVVGALFLFGLFTTGDSAVNQSDAFRAVEGWGGDWAVTWTDGDLACVRADFVGDTEVDTDELETALTRWAEERESAQVSRVDGRARLESCGGGAGAVPPQV